MFGMGIGEFLLIVLLALVAFGAPAVVAYWIGFQAGSKNTTAEKTQVASADASAAAERVESPEPAAPPAEEGSDDE